MGTLGFISTLSKASGTITGVSEVDITQNETIVIGGHTYVWLSPVSSGDKHSLLFDTNDVEIGLQSLVHAINGTGVVGTTYLQALEDDRVTNPPLVTATRSSLVVTLSALLPGRLGNGIALTAGTSNLSVSGAHLTGGAGSMATVIDEIQAQCQLDSEVITALRYLETGE